jgi:hypothetical protein
MAEFRPGLLLDLGFEPLPELFTSVYSAAAATIGDQLLELVNFLSKPENSIRHAEPVVVLQSLGTCSRRCGHHAQ